MSDQPVPEPVEPEPAANPWARLEEAGIDPNDPHLMDRLQWGADMMDHSRRAQAIEYLLEQDPTVRSALEAKFAPQPTPESPVNPWEQPAAEPEYYDPAGGPDPAQIQEWIKTEAQSVASQQLEAFRAEQAEQRLDDLIYGQVQAIDGLTPLQQDELWNRTKMNVQAGRVDQSTFPSAARDALQEIRGVWAPPEPVAAPDPVLTAGQRYAERVKAPMVAAGNGPAPSGDQPIESPADSAALARRIIAENQAQGY